MKPLISFLPAHAHENFLWAPIDILFIPMPMTYEKNLPGLENLPNGLQAKSSVLRALTPFSLYFSIFSLLLSFSAFYKTYNFVKN